MKKTSFIYTTLALLMLITVNLPGQEVAFLTILSSPPGGQVRLNSVLIGATPIYKLSVDPRTYTVEVSPPAGGLWNWKTRSFTLHLAPGQDTTLQVTYNTPIFLNSLPSGAAVYLDTLLLGHTPLYLSSEIIYGKTLWLEKDGYKPQKVTIREKAPGLFLLVPAVEQVPVQKKPSLLGVLPTRHLKSKFSLLALTLASHWASFYLKNQADDYYEKYRKTADPQLMNRYWDKTRRYDRYTEIALGISYLSLSGLIYFVVFK